MISRITNRTRLQQFVAGAARRMFGQEQRRAILGMQRIPPMYARRLKYQQPRARYPGGTSGSISKIILQEMLSRQGWLVDSSTWGTTG